MPKFVQPDYATQTGTAYPLNLDADMKVLSRMGAAYNPCAEDNPTALKVVVQAGAMFVNGALVANAAQTVTLAAAHATLPRIDRVVIDAVTGVASKIDGTAAASPTPPAITAGKLPVAQVLVTALMTVVTNNAITDERAIVFDAMAAAMARPAASGYTRIAPNFCSRPLGTFQLLSTGVCTAVPLPDPAAKMVEVAIDVWTLSGNAVASRTAQVDSHNNIVCSGGMVDRAYLAGYEFVATPGGILLDEDYQRIKAPPVAGNIYLNKVSGAAGYYITGYWD